MSQLPLTIRRAKPSDSDCLYQIEVECFHEDAFPPSSIKIFLKEPRFITLVTVLNGEIVGFVTSSIELVTNEVAGHICTINVKSNYRRKGIGSCLLKAIEEALIERGAKKCYLEVEVNNIAAKNLYSKHGYKFLNFLKNYYGFGRNGIRLIKRLDETQGQNMRDNYKI